MVSYLPTFQHAHDGKIPLFAAVESGEIELVNVLLENNADVEVSSS